MNNNNEAVRYFPVSAGFIHVETPSVNASGPMTVSAWSRTGQARAALGAAPAAARTSEFASKRRSQYHPCDSKRRAMPREASSACSAVCTRFTCERCESGSRAGVGAGTRLRRQRTDARFENLQLRACGGGASYHAPPSHRRRAPHPGCPYQSGPRWLPACAVATTHAPQGLATSPLSGRLHALTR